MVRACVMGGNGRRDWRLGVEWAAIITDHCVPAAGVIFDTETDQLQSAMLAAMREQKRNPSFDFELDPTISVINTVNVYKISRLSEYPAPVSVNSA